MTALPPTQVIGCGLIGTSVALGLREQGIDVFLTDADPTVAADAAERGAGTVGEAPAPAAVVVAVPPSAAADTAVRALERWPHAVVTDVASVKAGIGAAVAARPGADRYVGSHPMAGSERSGPSAGSAQLFAGRPWAIAPTERSGDDAVRLVEEIAVMLGAVPIRMDAGDHDAAVALVSHLPHLLSVLAASRLTGAPTSHLALSGPGLRDVTRIAGSDPRLWIDILGANAEPVRAQLRAVRADLDRVIDALAPGSVDAGTLADVLGTGRAGTRLIPGKHGGTPADLATVYVQIPDTPGALSRLFAHTGESGVNIEDMRIDHELGRPVGLVEIAVVTGDADHLVTSLTERGWSAYR
ncbi:MAG: prephenate dehydrogenase [Aeromicrobium erythreum]